MTVIPTNLGSFYPMVINNLGQMAGGLVDSYDLALWQSGVVSDISLPQNVSPAYATGLNDSGEVVGYWISTGSGSPVEQAFQWENGTFSVLSTNAGVVADCAYAINDSGLIVGYESTSTDTSACEWQNGVMTVLAKLPSLSGGSDASIARAVNSIGQIVGADQNSNNQQHAVLWSSGTVTDLGALNSFYNQSYATGINNEGQVIGWSAINNTILPDGETASHAFIWSRNAGMVDLGTLGGIYVDSLPLAINDLGQVVGAATNISVPGPEENPTVSQPGQITLYAHALLWQNGTITDLNSLLPENSGWVLQFATGINDAGQIIGLGTYDGAYTSFELSLQGSGPLITNTVTGQAILVAPIANSTIHGAGNDILDLAQNPIASASSAYTLSANFDGSFMLTTSGSSDQVSGILQVEFSDKTITVVANNSFGEYAALLYQGALGRTPDAAGLENWDVLANALPTSEQATGVYALSNYSGNFNGNLSIAGGFTNSTEFETKYGSLTNTQFVTQLYSNILDRAPDPTGYATWMGELSAGQSREHVLVGFAESAEAITNATNGFTGQSGTHAAWLFLA